MDLFKLTDKFTADDVAALANVEQNPRTRTRLWAVRLLLLNEPPDTVCKTFDCQLETLAAWVERFNRDGPQGLNDLPRSGPGKLLKPDQEDAFRQRVLDGPKPEDGIHTFRLLDFQLILEREFQAKYTSLPGVWKLCKRLMLSHLMPRPYNPKADPVAQEAFKKSSLKKSKTRGKNTRIKALRSGARTRCAPASTAL
jgi:transposase